MLDRIYGTSHLGSNLQSCARDTSFCRLQIQQFQSARYLNDRAGPQNNLPLRVGHPHNGPLNGTGLKVARGAARELALGATCNGEHTQQPTIWPSSHGPLDARGVSVILDSVKIRRSTVHIILFPCSRITDAHVSIAFAILKVRQVLAL